MLQVTTGTGSCARGARIIVEAATETSFSNTRSSNGCQVESLMPSLPATPPASPSPISPATRTVGTLHGHAPPTGLVMKLVELIRGMATADKTFAAVETTQRMGKTTVTSVKDMPGFIVNRVLMPYINEAYQALYEGIASVEDIDQAMKLGTNVPMGPLTLADFIGLDTCLAIMRVLHEGFADSKYRPSPLLVKYVEAGWLGRKAGRGFYDYSAQ